MSSIPVLTDQVNSIGGCSSPQDCCNEINGLKGTIGTLSARISALENRPSNDNSEEIKRLASIVAPLPIALAALSGEFAALSAFVASLAAGIAGIGAQIAAVAAAAAAAVAEAAAVAAALAPVLAAVAGIAGIAFLANKALDIAQANSAKVGPIGPAGERGLPGTPGATGATGERGLQGLQGAIGLAGERGLQGLQGAIGLTGERGLQGLQGAIGLTGERGLQGYTGAIGLTGERGLQGYTGAMGATGERGLQGYTGATGATGERGYTGSPGATGATGERGYTGSPGAIGATGERGYTGSPGSTGSNGSSGAQGERGLTGAPGTNGLPGEKGSDGLIKTITINEMTPGKEEEIINLIKANNFAVNAIPAALVASTQFRSASISAAAAGSCQSSQPGGCPGGTPDRLTNLDTYVGGLYGAINAVNTTLLAPISGKLDLISNKLGTLLPGGLGKWVGNIANVANNSQILNALTYIATLHNAYFLSNALSQTLFSAVGNSLAALGLKDTSQDPAGQPLNISKIVGDYTEGFFKAAFGVEVVNGIKSDWKKYSRIYQASAQVLSSFQSIGHSILGALEVVGSHVAKIGNAIQKFRVVSEKAYAWMNPTPSFQNRFLVGLQTAQTVVSQVDQVASETLSIQQQVTEIQKNSTELQKTMGQEAGSKQATATPEAATVKADAATAKAASKSPAIPETAIVKPD